MPKMIVLRSLLFYLYFFLITGGFGLALGTVGRALPISARNRMAESWGALSLAGLKVFCGLSYRVAGAEHLAGQDQGVILAKHQSAWETLALRVILPNNQVWVLKRELLFLPLFGWGLAACKPIAIDRSQPKKALKQVLKEGVSRVQGGNWLVIFPEGTRVAPGERGKYGASGAMIAKKAGVRAIPIAHNAGVFWARNTVKKYPGTIELVIGPPIDPTGKSAQETTDVAEEWIEQQQAILPKVAESIKES